MFTKSERKVIEKLLNIVYERELGRELELLESQFALWHKGEIDAFELSERIHKYHQIPARKLYSIYNTRFSNEVHILARAICKGLLTPNDIDPPLRERLAEAVDEYRRSWAVLSNESTGYPNE